MITKEEFEALHELLKKALSTDIQLKMSCYYVGGCTRDMILQRPISNVNVAVLTHNGGQRFAELVTKFYKCYEEGVNPIVNENKGTAIFNLGKVYPRLKHINIEASMTRCKNVIGGKVQFGGIREDASLRDFTINAIYANIDHPRYLDVIGCSLKDIEDKKIRTCSDALSSFSEDPLKILRAIRFSSQLGWGLPKNTWLGICKNIDKLSKIDVIDVQKEFNKIITSDFAEEGIRKLYHSDAMHWVIPDFDLLKGLKQGKTHNQDVFDHSLTVMSKTQPILEHRLAGLLHDVGKVATYQKNLFDEIHFYQHEKVGAETTKMILEFLRYPDELINKVSKAVELHMKFKNASIPSKHAIRRFIKDAGEENLDICLDVIDADNNSHAPKHCKKDQVENVRKRIEKIKDEERGSKILLPINGKDIMKKFKIKKGPQIGNALALLKEHSAISPKMTKEEAFSIIEEALAKNKL